jgi:hypothetical protein
MSISPNCIHNYNLHELHTFHTHEALVMFTLKEVHTMCLAAHTCWRWFPQWKGNTFNRAICILLVHFYYSVFYKKKMTMVMVEVPGIACYLPSSLVQNVVQLFVTWERGEKKKKVKPAIRQFGKDHSPTFLSHSITPHTHVQFAPKLVHNK